MPPLISPEATNLDTDLARGVLVALATSSFKILTFSLLSNTSAARTMQRSRHCSHDHQQPRTSRIE
jgi:hypothetical protein